MENDDRHATSPNGGNVSTVRVVWRVISELLYASYWGVLWFAPVVMAANTNAGARFSRLGSRLALIIWFIAFPTFGVFGYSIFGGFLGGLVGFLIGVVVIWAIFVLRLMIAYPLPECKRGVCCGCWNYHWAAGSLCGLMKWDQHLYWCCCGDSYVRQGRRFLVIIDNETLRPYKKLIGFRRWAKDDCDQNEKSA